MSKKRNILNLTAFITSMVIMMTSFNFFPAKKIVAYDYLSYGIDVSKFQGTIDWNEVATDNVDFAIIRAGTTSINGETYSQDSYFEYNYTNAKDAGIKLGAYYYCGAFSEEGFKQNAYDFLNSLSGKTFDFPVYIDIEQASMQKELGKYVLTTYIMSALSIIDEAGYTAGVYANKDWFTNYVDISRIKDAGYEIWWAQYPSGSYAFDPTLYDKSDECGVWQYSSLGSIKGINGNVDLDVSYVNYANTESTPPYNPDKDPDPDTSSYSTGTYMVNTTSGLNVRSAPNTSGSILCAAPNGTSFYVEKVSGEWGYTSSITGYSGNNLTTKSGWVSLKYCEYLGPIETTTIPPTESTTVTTDSSDNDKIKVGDINNDNIISIADAVLLQKYLLGAEKFTKEMYESADLNFDGVVDVFDMVLMRKAVINYK